MAGSDDEGERGGEEEQGAAEPQEKGEEAEQEEEEEQQAAAEPQEKEGDAEEEAPVTEKTAQDVFGADDSDEEDAGKKAKDDDDGDASAGKASDDSDGEPQRKLKRKKAKDDDDGDASGGKASDDSDEEAPRKLKRKHKEKKEKKSKKEKPAKKRRTRAEGPAAVEEEEAAGMKEVRNWDNSDDEEEAIGRGDVFDTETGKAVKGEKEVGGKLSKRELSEVMFRERKNMRDFITTLKDAAYEDKEAYKSKQMATGKTALLAKLKDELCVKRKQAIYLQEGVLKSLKVWLEPLEDKKAKSLPNLTLLLEVIKLLFHLPIDEDHREVALDPKMPSATKDYLDYVKESDIGKAIQFIKKTHQADKSSEIYRAAARLVQKWSRLIFKKTTDYKKAGGDDDDEDEDETYGQRGAKAEASVRANREWERIPDCMNSSGVKATRGEYGFRYGASVPRPMLVDFQVAPRSKIKVEEMLEESKNSKNEIQQRLRKVAVEEKKRNMNEKNERAQGPELNRMLVGGIAAKTVSMGWADRTVRHVDGGPNSESANAAKASKK